MGMGYVIIHCLTFEEAYLQFRGFPTSSGPIPHSSQNTVIVVVWVGDGSQGLAWATGPMGEWWCHHHGERIVGGGHQEDMTIAGWPESWTRTTRGSFSFPCPWDVCSVHCSYTRSYFKDTTLREQCDAETIWTEHAQDLYINF